MTVASTPSRRSCPGRTRFSGRNLLIFVPPSVRVVLCCLCNSPVFLCVCVSQCMRACLSLAHSIRSSIRIIILRFVASDRFNQKKIRSYLNRLNARRRRRRHRHLFSYSLRVSHSFSVLLCCSFLFPQPPSYSVARSPNPCRDWRVFHMLSADAFRQSCLTFAYDQKARLHFRCLALSLSLFLPFSVDLRSEFSLSRCPPPSIWHLNLSDAQYTLPTGGSFLFKKKKKRTQHSSSGRIFLGGRLCYELNAVNIEPARTAVV